MRIKYTRCSFISPIQEDKVGVLFPQCRLLQSWFLSSMFNQVAEGIVQNMDWTGLGSWTGLDSWTGLNSWTGLDGTVGLDSWTGQDSWTGLIFTFSLFLTCTSAMSGGMAQTSSQSRVHKTHCFPRFQ